MSVSEYECESTQDVPKAIRGQGSPWSTQSLVHVCDHPPSYYTCRSQDVSFDTAFDTFDRGTEQTAHVLV